MQGQHAASPGGPRVAVLACQGGFESHLRSLRSIGVAAAEARSSAQIEGADALIIPGGESTTVMKAIERDGLSEPIRRFAASGRPVFGTCAGAIVLDRGHLDLLDIRCERNAYGRQIASFEAPVRAEGAGSEPFRAVFIRAPKIRESGEAVDVLATYEGDPVLVRERNLMAATFHPELAGDARLHALFTAMIGSASVVGR